MSEAGGVHCPKCMSETTVVDTRAAPNNRTRRRRKCLKRRCKHRFTTYEATLDMTPSDQLLRLIEEIDACTARALRFSKDVVDKS